MARTNKPEEHGSHAFPQEGTAKPMNKDRQPVFPPPSPALPCPAQAGTHLLADQLAAGGAVPQVQQRAHGQGEAKEGRGQVVLVACDVLHKLQTAEGTRLVNDRLAEPWSPVQQGHRHPGGSSTSGKAVARSRGSLCRAPASKVVPTHGIPVTRPCLHPDLLAPTVQHCSRGK